LGGLGDNHSEPTERKKRQEINPPGWSARLDRGSLALNLAADGSVGCFAAKDAVLFLREFPGQEETLYHQLWGHWLNLTRAAPQFTKGRNYDRAPTAT
jgi:hypothetical protein